MRHLAALNVLEKTEGEQYAMTPLSEGLGEQPELKAAFDLFFEIQMPLCLHLPAFLPTKHYEDPANFEDGVFSFYSGKTTLDYLQSHPLIDRHLGDFLTLYSNQRESWFNIYPIEPLVEQCRPGTPLVVDVGGNVGRDLEALCEKFPGMAQRLILQDRPEVLERSPPLHSSVEKMPHNFFSEQPVKGKTHCGNCKPRKLTTKAKQVPPSITCKYLLRVRPPLSCYLNVPG